MNNYIDPSGFNMSLRGFRTTTAGRSGGSSPGHSSGDAITANIT
jgi:hypothetical protein